MQRRCRGSHSPLAPLQAGRELNSVSCATSSDCVAVGNYYPTSCCTDRTLIEQNPGGGWGVASSPNATTVNNNSLRGVTCVTPTNCWAVGSYDFSNRVSTEIAPLIQHSTASGWKIVGTNPTG